MKMNQMKPGDSGVITGISGVGPVKRRLVDMGVTPGAVVFIRKVAPLGDPIEINIRGYELSLRRADAEQITVDCEGAII